LVQILQAWQVLQSQIEAVAPPAYALTAIQESYLNTISRLIDVTRELVRDRAAQSPPIGYRCVESAGEVRLVRDIYTFRLAPAAPTVNRNDFLRLRGAPETCGRALALEGDRLTIKFEGPVDRARIPEQGIFEKTESDRPFQLQQGAVETLRAGEANNPYLLRVLVDHAYQPYQPASTPPTVPLNSAQAQAFRCSLTVPDLLLVLGPPGTGKTKTITEIVRQHGLEHRRVLVSAKTHKAVDNVLERLPTELTTVRIGHEDKVSESTRHLLIDAQARSLQATILRRTEPHAQALSDLVNRLDAVQHQADQLAELVGTLETAEVRLRDAQQQLKTTEDHINALYGGEVHRLQAALKEQGIHLRRMDETLERLTQRQVAAEAKRRIFLLGPLWAWWSRHLVRRIQRHQEKRRRARDVYNSSAQACARAWNTLRQAFRTPEYRQMNCRAYEANRDHQTVVQTALEAAHWLDRAVAGLTSPRPAFEPVNPARLRRYLAWFRSIVPLLQQRCIILNEWRTRLELRTKELYPVLIHFADVVGATCIGIATDPNFEEVDFDLLIADEAGQIGLPDLLVPLVRAKRALLVGDHHQLPPFVEDEVQAWLRQVTPESLLDLAWMDEEATEAETVTGLLTQSAFEALFPKADPAHVVRFDQQYRMPQAIADFAAQHFYEGQLRTVGNDKVYGAHHADPLFKKPLAFVDTSSLPPVQREESFPGQDRTDREAWGMPGYVNRLEASLIAEIAAVYDHEGLDWAVIVPYRAQAALIRQELARRLPAAPDLNLEERVATVDSFQGGERDRILYGFTRSNRQGEVGFLRELRRLNVALTRARQQLVLVGDAITLTQAHNVSFRDVARALLTHTRQVGELLSYEECQVRLATRRQGAP
jgi:superfamily I DNA/RNA helicase